jgi:hypothetical protein
MDFGFIELREVMVILQSLEKYNYKRISITYLDLINFTDVRIFCRLWWSPAQSKAIMHPDQETFLPTGYTENTW